MGYISLTIVSSVTLLMAYSILISGAQAKLVNSGEGTQAVANELMQKRPLPAVWLKSYPVRRLKPVSSYRLAQPTEVEFIDDTVNDIEKRFDDYGHMRFGKRGGGEGEGFDDYGNLLNFLTFLNFQIILNLNTRSHALRKIIQSHHIIKSNLIKMKTNGCNSSSI